MIKYYLTVIIGGLVLISCGSKIPDLTPEASSKTVSNVPEWVLNTPKKDGYMILSATAVSQSMQLAIDKARVSAVSNLSQMIKSEWSGHTKRVQEETGLTSESQFLDRFSQVQENVLSNQLENVVVVNKDIQVENSNGIRIYRAYVLVEYNQNAAQENLLAKIKADQELYDAIRATELVQDMEEKVEAYRQRYAE